MSSQVAIVQSALDERELVDALTERHRILAVPRVLAQPKVQAVALGECDAEKQLLFMADDAELIRSAVQEIENASGTYQVDRTLNRGRFIEWNRTIWIQPNVARPGRFYYNRPTSPMSPSGRVVDQTMRKIQTWIKTNSPMRSHEIHPIYVGAHLSDMVQGGRAHIIYPNGSPISLVENA